MKHCQKCNLDFPITFRFCGTCGDSLSEALYCQSCGDMVESKWAFCTNCGKKVSAADTNSLALLGDVPSPTKVSAPALAPSQTKTVHPVEQRSPQISQTEWYAAPDLFEDTGTTVTPVSPPPLTAGIAARPPLVTTPAQSNNGKSAPTLTMLSAYGEPATTAPPDLPRPRALLLVLMLLVAFGAVGFGSVYWWTHRASAAQPSFTTDAKTDSQPAAESSSFASNATNNARETANASADEDWKRLREQRIGAKPSEAVQITNSLEEAEKKYGSDYRFPYERAKLSIKGITSHHDAFGALALAAEKAIEAGKAQEMLDSLIADKDGDFYRLSRGHHEWQALVQALSEKDKKGLGELHRQH